MLTIITATPDVKKCHAISRNTIRPHSSLDCRLRAAVRRGALGPLPRREWKALPFAQNESVLAAEPSARMPIYAIHDLGHSVTPPVCSLSGEIWCSASRGPT